MRVEGWVAGISSGSGRGDAKAGYVFLHGKGRALRKRAASKDSKPPGNHTKEGATDSCHMHPDVCSQISWPVHNPTYW